MDDGRTKMIIITSNEEIIRQFSANNSSHTRIIDLDDNEQVSSILKDTNIRDLAHLTELSQINSRNEQVYKRALDSTENRQRPTKISKKATELTCVICGDQAIGFNYDVLSCASCKAFFHRNAYQQMEQLRCLGGQGQCSVDHGVRRKCQRCRLEKCFAVGMRKDFILTEEEKRKRKQRIEENRNISLTTTNTSETVDASNNLTMNESFHEIDRFLTEIERSSFKKIEQSMLIDDWLATEYLSTAFSSLFQHERPICADIDVSNHATALISWSQSANKIALDLIKYFRQIEQFELLNDDDRFILVKYNLLPLFPIVKSFIYKENDDCLSPVHKCPVEKYQQFMNLCDESFNMCGKFLNLVESIIHVTEKDPKFVALLVAILIFSQGLSFNEHEPSTKDSVVIVRAQFHYTTLLWNYLVAKLGEAQASKRFINLLNVIFRIQSTAKMSREFFSRQVYRSDTVDKIEPLMQSVLHIS